MTFRKAQALSMITILLTALFSVGVWADDTTKKAYSDADYDNAASYPDILDPLKNSNSVNWKLAQDKHPELIPRLDQIPPADFNAKLFADKYIGETDPEKKAEWSAKLQAVTQPQWAAKDNFQYLPNVFAYPNSRAAVQGKFPDLFSVLTELDASITLKPAEEKFVVTDAAGRHITVDDKTVNSGKIGFDEKGNFRLWSEASKAWTLLKGGGKDTAIQIGDSAVRIDGVAVSPKKADTPDEVEIMPEGIKIANGDLTVTQGSQHIEVHDHDTLVATKPIEPKPGESAVYIDDKGSLKAWGVAEVSGYMVDGDKAIKQYDYKSEETGAKVEVSRDDGQYNFALDRHGPTQEGKPIIVQAYDETGRFIERKFQYNKDTQRFDYEASKDHLLFDENAAHPGVQFKTEGKDVRGSVEVTPAQPGQPTPQPEQKESGGLFSSPILWGIVGGLLGFFLFGGVLGVALGAVGGYVLSTFLIPKPSETVTGTTTPEGTTVTSEITGQPYKCGNDWCYTDPNKKEETLIEGAKTYDDALKAYREKIGATKEQPEAPSAGVAKPAEPAKTPTEAKPAEPCPDGKPKQPDGTCPH
ncbi:hypothetical protein HY642_04965 [Candidatus Woesearchaeota archaeon]|nr:hypothetical protein [Candidatus Woesearchaeota archaeon]